MIRLLEQARQHPVSILWVLAVAYVSAAVTSWPV